MPRGNVTIQYNRDTMLYNPSAILVIVRSKETFDPCTILWISWRSLKRHFACISLTILQYSSDLHGLGFYLIVSSVQVLPSMSRCHWTLKVGSRRLQRKSCPCSQMKLVIHQRIGVTGGWTWENSRPYSTSPPPTPHHPHPPAVSPHQSPS